MTMHLMFMTIHKRGGFIGDRRNGTSSIIGESLMDTFENTCCT